MKNNLELNDVIEIFLNQSIYEIKKEKEIPNINFFLKKIVIYYLKK